MDVNLGIESNNKRSASLKRWLAKPPHDCVKARLLVVADPPLVLREWPVNMLVPGLAAEIEADINEHAEQDGAQCVEFLLVFEAEGGRAVSTKRMQVLPRRGGHDDALATAASIDATRDSWVVQMQRHMEAFARMYFTGNQTLLQQAIAMNAQVLELNTQLTERMLSAYSREDDAREFAAQLRELQAELTQQQQSSEGAEEKLSPSQERFQTAIMNFLQLVASKYAGATL